MNILKKNVSILVVAFLMGILLAVGLAAPFIVAIANAEETDPVTLSDWPNPEHINSTTYRPIPQAVPRFENRGSDGTKVTRIWTPDHKYAFKFTEINPSLSGVIAWSLPTVVDGKLQMRARGILYREADVPNVAFRYNTRMQCTSGAWMTSTPWSMTVGGLPGTYFPDRTYSFNNNCSANDPPIAVEISVEPFLQYHSPERRGPERKFVFRIADPGGSPAAGAAWGNATALGPTQAECASWFGEYWEPDTTGSAELGPDITAEQAGCGNVVPPMVNPPAHDGYNTKYCSDPPDVEAWEFWKYHETLGYYGACLFIPQGTVNTDGLRRALNESAFGQMGGAASSMFGALVPIESCGVISEGAGFWEDFRIDTCDFEPWGDTFKQVLHYAFIAGTLFYIFWTIQKNTNVGRRIGDEG